jgi:hypothetical protein
MYPSRCSIIARVAKQTYKKYTRVEQRSLAKWAADCAERVLPLFERAFPHDDRPREAIATLDRWIQTGEFKMSVIRGASLGAHAAARSAMPNEAVTFAARAAGQAVGTAHVTQHAYGAALYALKAIVAQTADPQAAAAKVNAERNWQSRRLPTKLRKQVMSRIIIEQRAGRVAIKLRKGKGF